MRERTAVTFGVRAALTQRRAWELRTGRTLAHTQTTEIKRGSKKRHAFIEARELGLRVSLQMQTKDSEVRAHKPVS